MSAPHVLVSGAGIAGIATALQLVRGGIRTTVVERAPEPRPGGQAVDLRGASREAAERMGLMPGISAHRLHEKGMVYVDGRGRSYGRMPVDLFDGRGAVADVEIARGDLNQVLLDALAEADAAAPGLLSLRYGDRIEALVQDEAGVEARFASGGSGRFDAVLGADGVHSATRRLAFGSEERFATRLGGYAAFFTMPTPVGIEDGWFSMRIVPGAMLGIRPDRDPATSKAMLTLRVGRDAALRGDRAAQEALIRRLLSDAGWQAPAVLAAMSAAEDFYFDELARVDVPDLVNARVALVGDAGYCGTPLSGMGTAMALVGAFVLAGELVEARAEDVPAALARYARRIEPFIADGKKIPFGSLERAVPTTRAGAALGRLTTRVMLSKPFLPLITRAFAANATDELPLPDPASAPLAR
ncbi:FAD-dependent monooxygenase [Microbacterium sp. 13-71-7]|jgi:2-polyprenyl-6-methoxyphenol hydroxylase-like FAD-dependent oxidoreductase|uniref:FAD-dependent monooxygenase n=1 Tax=Microbacterium sp. 13-71-7 TaxID=1970399 RepID=UPI000BD210E3|nr:FAD-dependent monooxygenase [Microbacterium sp. 13-71-7]OZB85327.1 MAG: FAD-binding monooxygenase [Microbacterium sp. 13-71-7]